MNEHEPPMSEWHHAPASRRFASMWARVGTLDMYLLMDISHELLDCSLALGRKTFFMKISVVRQECLNTQNQHLVALTRFRVSD